jgi:hypothetical protein
VSFDGNNETTSTSPRRQPTIPAWAARPIPPCSRSAAARCRSPAPRP